MALYRSCVPSIDEKVQAIMLERTRYPAGVPCWVDTAQRDPRAAVAFYGGLFGWEFEDSMPPDSPVRYLLARLRGRDVAPVGSATDLGPPTPVWNTYISVESADETATRVTRAGCGASLVTGTSSRGMIQACASVIAKLAHPEGSPTRSAGCN